MHSVERDSSALEPLDLWHVHLGNWESFIKAKREYVDLYVELGKEGVQRCESDLGRRTKLHMHEDGTGWLDGKVPKSETSYLAKFFIGLGDEATVIKPPELVDSMKQMLSGMMAKYIE